VLFARLVLPVLLEPFVLPVLLEPFVLLVRRTQAPHERSDFERDIENPPDRNGAKQAVSAHGSQAR